MHPRQPPPTSDPVAIPKRLDPSHYTKERYDRVAPRLAFRPDPAWRPAALARLRGLIGPFPDAKVPLQVEVGPGTRRPGHIRYPVTFATRDGMAAFAYLLVPEGLKGPAPAVVCIPGHGRGVDDLVGIAEDGTDRDHRDGYMHDFAIQCTEKGQVALAVEPLGFGHRRSAEAAKGGPGGSSCRTAAGAALLLGETLLGWRVWDIWRSLDFLESRPEVDPRRIAAMGISGGGTIALYAAALDERIKATVLSCSFCTFRDSIYSVAHCIDNFVPGLLLDFEMADIAALVAPRFLFCEAGSDDHIFPTPGVRVALEQAGKAFAAQGAADRIDSEIFSGGHLFHGDSAFRKLRDWL